MKRQVLLTSTLLLAAGMFAQTPAGNAFHIDYDEFQSSNSLKHLDAGNNTVLNPGDQLTAMCWIQLRDIGDNQKILGKFNLDNTGYILAVDQGKVYAEVWNPTHYDPLNGLMNPTAQYWYHIAMTYTRGVALKSYINGVEVGSTVVSNAPISTSNNRLIIGVSSWMELGSFQTFGNLDEIALYNVALTPDQIKAQMFKGIDGSEAGLIAGYNFDAPIGNTAADLSGNGNTAVGSATFTGTEWAQSKAPLADDNTATASDLNAIWKGKSLTGPWFTSTTNGLNLTATAMDTTDYAVFGHNEGIGVTANDIPTNAPADFMRTERVWPLTNLGDASMSMVMNLNAAAGGGTVLDLTQPAWNYALLWRPAGASGFVAVANGSSFMNGVVTFTAQMPNSGEYAIGVGSAITQPIGIEEHVNVAAFKIAPNPNQGVFAVSMERAIKGAANLQVMDAAGRIVHQEAIRSSGVAGRVHVDLGSVAKGIYLVKLSAGGSFHQQRIVVE